MLLAYSELFGQDLILRSLINLKKAKEKLNEHFGLQGRESHQAAVERAQAFGAIQDNQAVGKDQQIGSRHAQLIAENKMKLRSINSCAHLVWEAVTCF